MTNVTTLVLLHNKFHFSRIKRKLNFKTKDKSIFPIKTKQNNKKTKPNSA